jgi:hypothetical protein
LDVVAVTLDVVIVASDEVGVAPNIVEITIECVVPPLSVVSLPTQDLVSFTIELIGYGDGGCQPQQG